MKHEFKKFENKGEGRDNGETGFQWMVIGTEAGDVVYVEYWFKSHLDSTEVSCDTVLSEAQVEEIGWRVGYLWSDEAPKIPRPDPLANEWSH